MEKLLEALNSLPRTYTTRVTEVVTEHPAYEPTPLPEEEVILEEEPAATPEQPLEEVVEEVVVEAPVVQERPVAPATELPTEEDALAQPGYKLLEPEPEVVEEVVEPTPEPAVEQPISEEEEVATTSTVSENETTPKVLEDMPLVAQETEIDLDLFDENGVEKG